MLSVLQDSGGYVRQKLLSVYNPMTVTRTWPRLKALDATHFIVRSTPDHWMAQSLRVFLFGLRRGRLLIQLRRRAELR